MKYDNLLNEYRSGPELLERALSGFKPEELDYRPSWKGAWTAREHVIHLVDSEANAFVRIKSIIAQPGSDCYVMDEELWTANLRRKSEDLQKYLRLFSLLREIVCDLCRDEPEEGWTKGYFSRTYQGQTARMNLEKAIETYRNHVKFHLDYLERIKQELSK